MRFTVFNFIIVLGIYALIAFYRFAAIDFEITDTYYNFTLVFPLVSAILILMARRGIKKDEDLVRSIDRIR